MSTSPRVFISATTADLGSYRAAVADVLLKLDAHPVEQDHFPPDCRTLREILREKIGGCNAVICLLGRVYGSEPATRGPEEPRRSYTQIELEIAEELAKPIFIFIAAETCPTDRPSVEPPELAALQAEHVRRVMSGDRLWQSFGSVEELRHHVAVIRFQSPPRRRAFLAATAAVVVLFLAAALVGAFTRGPPQTIKGIRPPPAARTAQIERQIHALRSAKLAPARERMPNFQTQASLGTPDHSSFEILADDRIWDLRGYRPHTAESAPYSSFAVSTSRIRLLKVGPAKELRFESRTSGTDVFLRCPSHASRATEIVSESPAYVGGAEMKVRHIAIDLSDVDVGSDLNITLQFTYWDGFRTASDNWVGVIGNPQCDLVSLLVLFPDDRPYTGFELADRPTARKPPQPFVGDCLVFESPDKTAILWEIPFPASNHVFSLNWNW